MFLEYGVNEAGELVYIDQVGRGQLDGVYCPYCGGGLTAKKGRVIAHHFAHTADTCNPSQRDQDVIALPAFDRFDLNLSGKEFEALSNFHYGTGYYDLRQFNRLKGYGLITYNEYQRRDELTDTGKIPFGELSLSKFAVYQDEQFRRKHDRLIQDAQHATPGPERQQAITDLRLYRAQWQRVLSAALYFLEIEHGGDVLYKIGMTTRPLADRIAEIEQSLRTWLGEYPAITPLRVLRNRGAVELYFMHRYSAHQHALGSFTEYFVFEPRRNVLSDLTRLGDKDLTDLDRAILAGALPAVLQDSVTTQQGQPQDTVTVTTKTHRRTMPIKEYTFDCARCGQTVTLARYPGRAPSLCDDCAAARKREQARERVRRYRERRKD